MSRYASCSQCGNKSFAEEDGILTCSRCGLRLEGGLQVGDEEPEFGTQGNIVRKKIEKEKIKVTRIYRGTKAYRLYLQAWQHVLWWQVYALTYGTAKAPSQLWPVARNLWTLRLSKLVDRLDSSDTDTVKDDTGLDPVSTDEAPESEREDVKTGLYPKLWDSIGLIYISALLIRWPITLHKIHDLIRREDVPFIRAIRHVPIEMSSRMPQEYQRALDTLTIPAPRDVSQAIWRAISSYSIDFGMSLPALNWRIILIEWIQVLGLPIEVYATVKELAILLRCEFKYEVSTDSTDPQSKDTQKRPRKTPVAMAEVQLMSFLIIATKLLFPFSDGSMKSKPRGHPQLGLRWSAWLRTHKNYQPSQNSGAESAIQPGKHIEIQDRDVLTMSPEQLDSYMDWYQTTFAVSETVLQNQKTALEKSILDMFPVPDLSSTSLSSQSHNAEREASELPSRVQDEAVVPVAWTEGTGKERASDGDSDIEENDLQAGSRYPIFSTKDSLSFKSPRAERETEDEGANDSNAALYFHERAAELVCLDLNRLLKAVRYTERRLERLIEQKKRDKIFDIE